MNTIAQPSVQSLLLQVRFGEVVLGTATGFVVNSKRGPVLITNRHVVTGRHQQTGQPMSKTAGIPDNLVVWHNHTDKLGQWVATIEPLYAGGQPLWREHPHLGTKADIVALPITTLSNVHIYPYDPAIPGPDMLVGPSDVVSVVGFPFGKAGGGLFAIWATGFMAMEPVAEFDDLPVWLIDCRSRPGQSGSPVISYRSGGAVAMANGSTAMFAGPVWRFVGVYSGRVNAESDLGMVWKASALAELVEAM